MEGDAERALQRAAGQRISELRRRRGWTQEALAERLGMSAKYVQDVERGNENLTLQSLARFATFLDVRPAALLRAPTTSRAKPGRPRADSESPPFEEIEPGPGDLFRRCVPLVTLEAAAGAKREARLVEVASWVVPRTRLKLAPGMFVARVIGDSMAPEVPAGAWALFGSSRGSPVGRIVLVQHRESDDPGDTGAFVVKRAARGRRGVLRLLSANRRYPPIDLVESDERCRIVAELLTVL